jgi:hypothetical protein
VTDEVDGAVVIRLDATDTDIEVPAAVATRIPNASTLPPQTRVTVSRTATRRASVLRRLLGQKSVPVPRASLCTALLLRGYVDIGADDDVAWGLAPLP